MLKRPGNKLGSSSWLTDHLAQRDVERVLPNPRAREKRCNEIGKSLVWLRTGIDESSDTVFDAAYDRIRQCFMVHLDINGLRVGNVPGAHRLFIEYAEVMMADILSDDDLLLYSEYRRIRNNHEYSTELPGDISPATAKQAVDVATRFFKAIYQAHRQTIEK